MGRRRRCSWRKGSSRWAGQAQRPKAKDQRPKTDFSGVLWTLFFGLRLIGLHVIPQLVEHLEPGRRYLDSLKGRSLFHRRPSPDELLVRLVECQRRVDAALATEVHYREEQVSQLGLEICLTSLVRPGAARQVRTDF